MRYEGKYAARRFENKSGTEADAPPWPTDRRHGRRIRKRLRARASIRRVSLEREYHSVKFPGKRGGPTVRNVRVDRVPYNRRLDRSCSSPDSPMPRASVSTILMSPREPPPSSCRRLDGPCLSTAVRTAPGTSVAYFNGSFKNPVYQSQRLASARYRGRIESRATDARTLPPIGKR